MRARLWSKHAAVDVIHQENLTPATLTDRVLANLEKGPLKTSHELDFKGLDRVSARFGELWNGKEDGRATALRV
jgi:predicted glycosyltransferase